MEERKKINEGKNYQNNEFISNSILQKIMSEIVKWDLTYLKIYTKIISLKLSMINLNYKLIFKFINVKFVIIYILRFDLIFS